MSETAKRYLELLNEMEWHRATKGLTRAQEIEFAAQLDRLWTKVTDEERETIARELEAIDAAANTDEFLCDDAAVTHGSAEGPRRAA